MYKSGREFEEDKKDIQLRKALPKRKSYVAVTKV